MLELHIFYTFFLQFFSIVSWNIQIDQNVAYTPCSKLASLLWFQTFFVYVTIKILVNFSDIWWIYSLLKCYFLSFLGSLSFVTFNKNSLVFILFNNFLGKLLIGALVFGIIKKPFGIFILFPLLSMGCFLIRAAARFRQIVFSRRIALALSLLRRLTILIVCTLLFHCIASFYPCCCCSTFLTRGGGYT